MVLSGLITVVNKYKNIINIYKNTAKKAVRNFGRYDEIRLPIIEITFGSG